MWRVYQLLLYLANGLLILHQKEVKSPTEGIMLIYYIRYSSYQGLNEQ
jgi:hypothetical protein